MIEIYLLEQLAAFAEFGTLSAAAEHLHITQPALSRSMQKLEDALGVQLFERGKNKISLNDTGRLAADYAQRILQDENDMIRRVKAFDRSCRTLFVGACAPGPLMEFLPILSGLYSDMTLSSELKSEEELLRGLENDNYQIIILSKPTGTAGFYCVPCGSERLYLSVMPAHPAAGYREIPFSAVNGETFLMVSEVGIWKQIVTQNMPDSKFILQDSTESLMELTNYSTLPSFATDLVRRVRGYSSNRVLIPFSDGSATVHYYCVCKEANREKYRRWFDRLR
ncbi:MAG: LysR family transcriptional regulator [Clostridia bacterium]|nr:LysR family transcriptional regulator [Clostridia bacterium]